jgi:nicotinamide riboside kinase
MNFYDELNIDTAFVLLFASRMLKSWEQRQLFQSQLQTQLQKHVRRVNEVNPYAEGKRQLLQKIGKDVVAENNMEELCNSDS